MKSSIGSRRVSDDASPVYYSTKTYGHDRGFSCAFRQWRADSHCNRVHGYALGFRFVFGTRQLDNRNWVVDFGGLKDLKARLEDTFDHTTVVAEDDPDLDWFMIARERGFIKLVLMDNVGCEKFAKYAYELAKDWLAANGLSPRVWVESVEVSEHGSNSAIYSETRA